MQFILKERGKVEGAKKGGECNSELYEGGAGLSEKDVENRVLWKLRTRVADSK